METKRKSDSDPELVTRIAITGKNADQRYLINIRLRGLAERRERGLIQYARALNSSLVSIVFDRDASHEAKRELFAYLKETFEIPRFRIGDRFYSDAPSAHYADVLFIEYPK